MSGTPQKPNVPKAPNAPGARRPAPTGASGGSAGKSAASKGTNQNGAKKPQNRAPGSAQKPKPEALSIDSLLNDIELEEQKTVEAMPPIKSEEAKQPEPEKTAAAAAPTIVFDELEDDLDDLSDDAAEQPAPESKAAETSLDDDLDDDLDDIPAQPETKTAEEKTSDADAEPEKPAEQSEDHSSFWDDDSLTKAAGAAGLLTQLRGKLGGDTEESQKNRRSTIIIILLVIIIIILLFQQCGSCGGSGSKDGDSWFDQSAIEGTLPGKTQEEIQAMLNQIVEEGMFNISIAPVIVFENAAAEGQARIENVPANHYYMSVKITLDATAETVYESKGIKPGQYIEYITLQKELAPGEHAATALFKAYNADTLEEEGQVAVKITLYIEN